MTLFTKAKGPFYDEWESLDAATKLPIVQEKLHRYLEHASRNTEFYRGYLDRFDGGSDHPLARLPLLESVDLRQHIPPTGEGLLTDPSEGFTVFQSGGTTGSPKTALFSHRELEGINLGNSRGFFATGLTPEDRVANLWAVGGLYMTFVHMNRMLQQYGCTSFPFSNHTPSEFIETVARQFQINCFTGITSVVLNCLRSIHQHSGQALKIEKVYFGGEHIYESDRQELMETFGVKTIAAPGYGTVDSWYIGYQCEHTPPGVFHTHDDQVFVEITTDDGQPLVRGEVGMMVVTAWERQLTPIIRYRVGDKARWLPEPCPCGRTTPLFQLLGRGDDTLRIGYDSLDYAAVQQVVAEVSGLSGTLQMQKYREGGKDLLVLRVETAHEGVDATGVEAALEQQLLAQRPSLREFIAKGTVAPLKVEVYQPCGIPLNNRTGKLVRVIDVI